MVEDEWKTPKRTWWWAASVSVHVVAVYIGLQLGDLLVVSSAWNVNLCLSCFILGFSRECVYCTSSSFSRDILMSYVFWFYFLCVSCFGLVYSCPYLLAIAK